MSSSGHTKLAGVIGDPIDHSLSPRIHAHWLRAYGIDGAYVPLPVARGAFSVAIRGLQTAGFVGLNVTVPHKETAFAIAERLDLAAHACGAANLLVFREGSIEGRNTDAAGLSASLAEALGPVGLKGMPAVVLGAGGAARAACLALSGLGVTEIRIVARNLSRAGGLIRDLQPSASSQLRSFAWSDWPLAASGVTLLLNATSADMRGAQPLDLSLDPLPRTAAVCDIVYNPLETLLLKDARAKGHQVIDGLGMLMHQAAPSFAAFFGLLPAVTPLLRAELEEALRGGR
jgi:shikimate dehydrogenase